MKRSIPHILRFLVYIIMVGAFLAIAYLYRDTYRKRISPLISPIVEDIRQAIIPTSPCTRPITYSVGTFDPGFGLSQTQFLATVSKAAGVWDTALGRPLFVYATSSGDITLNLIYDYRQQATTQLQKIGIVINNDKATYDALKSKYDQLYASYLAEKTSIQTAIQAYDAHKAAYEAEVKHWNDQGGAPHDQYEKIQAELASLNAEGESINSRQASFNDLVSTLNATVSVLNRLASELNLNVTSYNTIGSSAGDEFDEGQYIEDASGKRINIFQFSSRNKLTRVLEHELGHALGLEHVDDPKAIMYKLNQSTNETLSAADLAELHRVCGMK